MEFQLTKDAEKMLCVMYKDYLEKRKSGITKSDSNYFATSHIIHEQLLPKWIFEDVDDTCRELSRAGLIVCNWGDDIAIEISISDLAISYMENRFKNGIKDITNFILKFIP